MSLSRDLQTEFSVRKHRNPRYSLRAFSRHLGLSPGALSKLLNGKIQASVPTMRKIVERLDLPHAEQERRILKWIGAATDSELQARLPLTESQIALMNRWEFSAIRTLLFTHHRIDDAKKVARHLGIAVPIARDCLEILEHQGLVEKKDGRYRCVGGRSAVALGHPNPNVSKVLKEYMELFWKAKEGPESTLTTFSGITIETDPVRFAKAVEKVREFRREMEELLSKGTPTRVFRLNVQLFPVDRPV